MNKQKIKQMLDDRIGQKDAHKLEEYEWIVGLMEMVAYEVECDLGAKNMLLETELFELKAENEKMKVGLFQRNGAITDLDIENKELREENKHLHFTNDLLNDLQEQIKNDAGVLARGFAVWLLSNYNTSEEGMSLCWIDAENNTKHGTNELFDIYFRKLA